MCPRMMQNTRIVLASRPATEPEAANFRLETTNMPDVPEGNVLVKNLFLSIDPYMRGRMSDRESYAKPVAIGDVMVGGTVGRVVESRAAGFSGGEVLVGYGGWQEYAVFDPTARGVLPVPSGLPSST